MHAPNACSYDSWFVCGISLQGCEASPLVILYRLLFCNISWSHTCCRNCWLGTSFWMWAQVLCKYIVFSLYQVSAHAYELFSVILRGLDELGHPTAGIFSISQRDEVKHASTGSIKVHRWLCTEYVLYIRMLSFSCYGVPKEHLTTRLHCSHTTSICIAIRLLPCMHKWHMQCRQIAPR